IAEPGIDGMLVRASRPGGPPSLEIDLDDDPGFEIDDRSFPVADAEPEVDLEPNSSASPPTLGSIRDLEPRAPSNAPPSQLDVEALDAPSLHEPADFAPAPFESGTWTLADDDDFEVGLDDPDHGQLPN